VDPNRVELEQDLELSSGGRRVNASRPLHVGLTKRIECLIEYPHDPLPGQAVRFGAQN
jgi:hypothetical protein